MPGKQKPKVDKSLPTGNIYRAKSYVTFKFLHLSQQNTAVLAHQLVSVTYTCCCTESVNKNKISLSLLNA